MTKSSTFTELTLGQKSEISADEATPNEPAVAAPRKKHFAYRATVMTVRGTLQLVIMVVVLVGATFLMNQLQQSAKERPKRVQQETIYTVEAIRAKAKNHQPTISVFGDVLAGRTLNLTSLVSGEVVDVNPALRVGARVKTGETLLQINRFTFEIARDEARANLKEAEATLLEARARLLMEETGQKRAEEQLKLADADLERAKSLLQTNTITQRVVEERELITSQRKAAFQSSGANIAIQKAQIKAREAAVQRFVVTLRNAEQALKNTTLVSPFDAVVQAVNVEVGQTVTTAASLLTLYQSDTLDVRFVLSDGQYGRLVSGASDLKGRHVSVNWTTGDTYTLYDATIDRIGAEISANRGGITLFARIESKDIENTIRPGAFVTVKIPDQSFEDSYRLPETAVFEGNVVYVINSEDRLVARTVTILVYDGDHVIVKDGLAEDDEVLITQIAEVGEGLLVRRSTDAKKARKSEGASADAAQPKPHG